MRIDSDDFELYGLPRRYAQDPAAIVARWLELQAQVHPDRHVAQGAAAQRVAMQWAVRVNEAHRRLRDPLQRAAYLCELAGEPIAPDRNSAMPGDFLRHQLHWREALEEAATPAEVEALSREVAAWRDAALADLAQTLDDRRDVAAAAAQVRALMFVERFAGDVDRRLEALGQ